MTDPKERSRTPFFSRRLWGIRLKVLIPSAAAALMVLLGLLVLLAPSILSTGPGTRFILHKVNASLDGRLDVDDLSLGWFSGIKVTDAKFTDSDGHELLSCGSLTSNASLFSLIRGNLDLGEVHVDSPVLNIVIPEEPPKKPKKPRKPWTEIPRSVRSLSGNFHVTNARVNVTGPSSMPELHLTNLNLAARVPSISQPITAELSFEMVGPARNGTVNLQTTVDGLAPLLLHNQVPHAELHLQADKLDLASLTCLAAAAGYDLRWSGTLKTNLDLKLEDRQLVLKGQTDLDQFALFGGPLGPDRLDLGTVSIPVDLELQPDRLHLTDLRVENPLVQVRASGDAVPGPHGWVRLEEYKDLKLTGSLNVQFARLADMLPNTLKLREGLRFLDGTLQADLKGANNPIQVSVNTTLKNLRATLDDKQITLDQDVTLDATMRSEDGKPTVPNLTFKSGFADLAGSGAADHFALNGTIDLAGLARQLRNFIRMDDVDLAGTLAVTLDARGDLHHSLQIDLQTDAQDLSVAGLFKKPFTQKRRTLVTTARLDTLNPPETWPKRLTLLAPANDAPTDKLRITTDNLLLVATDASIKLNGFSRPDVETFDLQLETDLAKAQAELGTLVELPAQYDLIGRQALSCTGSLVGDRLQLTRFQSTSTDLALTLKDASTSRTLTRKSLQCSGAVDYDLAAGTLRLPQLDLQVDPIHLKTRNLTLSRLSTPQPDLAVEHFDLTGTLVLADLLKEFAPFLDLADQLTLTGAESVTCAGSVADNTLHLETLQAVGSDLRIVHKGHESDPITQKNLTLEAAGSWNWNTSAVKLTSLSATGDFGTAGITDADLAHLGTDKMTCRAKSFQLKVDQPLATFTPYMNLPEDVRLAGRASLNTRGSLDGSTVTLDDLDASASSLLLTWKAGAKQVRQKTLTAKGSGKLDWKTFDLDLKTMNLAGDFGTADVSNLQLRGITSKKPTVRATVTSKAELAVLQNSFGDLLGLDPKTAYSGTETASFTIETTPDNHIRAEGTSTVVNFRAKAPDLAEINEPGITLDYKVDYDVDRLRLDLQTLKLTSAMLSLDAVGNVSDVGKSWTVNKLDGTIEYDLAKLRVLLNPWLPSDLKIEGRRRDTFTLSGILAGADYQTVLKGLVIKSGYGWTEASSAGINVGKLDNVLSGKDGKFNLTDIKTTVNNGPMTGSFLVDFRPKTPVLKKGDTDITVQRMAINDILTRSLLKYVNPIFGPGEAKGLITAQITKLTIPLEADAMTKAAIQMRAQADELDMEVKGLLAELIALVGGQQLRLQARVDPFDLIITEGKVSYNELTVHTGKVSLTFRGSISIKDKSVNMEVGLPLTEKLIANLPEPAKTLVTRMVGGERIYLPITGTIDKPRLGVEKLLEQVQKLIKPKNLLPELPF